MIVAMRFAILGDHPDGWAVARALATSGRHSLHTYCGPRLIEELSPEWPTLRVTGDLEEVLADPAVEVVIVAGRPGERLDQMRRVLQSERPALCVHPIDASPDGAYEINMLQGDVHQVVVPILPLLVNRSVADFHEKLLTQGAACLIELEYRAAGDLLFEGESAGPHFPGWEVLRRLGGTIAEVSTLARGEQAHRGEPVKIHGRFDDTTLFSMTFLPSSGRTRLILSAVATDGERLATDEFGIGDDDWLRLVERFETATARLRALPRAAPGAGPAVDAVIEGPTWLDEIRAAELDDAARRSIERHRAVTLDYQVGNEDVGFKGTMTLVGCGLLWLIPVLLILSVWLPYIGWLIVPALFGFLLFQLLRWFVPTPPGPGR